MLNEKFERDINNRIKSVAQYQNVFVAGDIEAGNHISLIGAIASGKKAANSVRKLLENYSFEYEGKYALEKLRQPYIKNKNEEHHANSFFTAISGVENFDLHQPCAKCNHCIDNFGCPAMVKINGKVTIDDKRCTRCGLCIDVCPNGAVEWVEEIVPLNNL